MEVVENLNNEATDDENMEKIEIIDLIIHKKWKYKIKGFEKLHTKIINNECIKLESDFFKNNLKKLLNNSVTEVIKSILFFFTNCFFNENIKNLLLNNYDYIFKILLEKYFSFNKLNIKKLCFNMFNLIFNNFDTKLFYDNLWVAWNSKNFKINYLAFNLIYMLIEENNIKKFKIKLFFKNMDKLINSSNKELRYNIIVLIKLLVKNFGIDILDVFKNIKKVMVDDIKKDYLESTKNTENNNLIDLYDVFEEENIFTKYNDIWFENLLKIKKWNEKKILLEELIKNSNKPKLAYSTNITKILQLIKKILIDKHIQVKILIIKFIGNLGRGIRKKIEKIWKPNVKILLNKLKEKNNLLIETILSTFEKLFYSIDLINYSSEIKDLINNKNSHLNHNILKLIIIYYRFCLKNDKNVCIFFNKFNNNIKELLKDKNYEVKKLLNNFLKNEIIKLAENQELVKIVNNLLGNINIDTNPNNLNYITENIKNNFNIPEAQNKSIWNLIQYLNSNKKLNKKFNEFLNEFFDNNFKNVNIIVLKSSLMVFSIISFKYFSDFENIIKINLPKILYFLVEKNVDIKKFIKEFIAKISENKDLRNFFIFSVNNIIKNNIIDINLKIKILKYFNKYIIINDKDDKLIIIKWISNSLLENSDKIVEISKLICKQFCIIFTKNDKFIDEIKNNMEIPIKSKNEIIMMAKSLNIKNNNNLLISKNNIKIINKEEQNFYKFLEKNKKNYNIDKNLILNNFINFNEPNDTEIYFITNKLKEYFKFTESNPFDTYQSDNLINLIEDIINYKNLDDIKDMLLWYIYVKLYDCSRKKIIEIITKLVKKLINNIEIEVETCIIKLTVNIIILIYKKNINKHEILDLLIDFNDNFIFDYIISLKIYIDTILNIINYLINTFKTEVLINESHIITLISLYLKHKKLIVIIFENLKKNKYFLNILDSNSNININKFFKEISWESIVKNFIKNINILTDFDKNFSDENYIIENIDYFTEIIVDITDIINNLTSDYRVNLFINFTKEFMFVYIILSKLLTNNLYCINIKLDNLKNIIQNTIILLYLTKTDLNKENYNFINNKDLYLKFEQFNTDINNILHILIKKLDYNLVLEIIFKLLIYFDYNDIENKINYICIVLKLWNKLILLFIDEFDTIDYIKTFGLFNLYFYKLINLNEQLNEIINNLLIEIKKNNDIFNLLKSSIDIKYLEYNYYNWESEIKIIESLMSNNNNEFNEFLNENYNNIILNIDKFKNIVNKIENDNKWNLFIKKK